MQTLIRRCVGDADAGLGLHCLHLSKGSFPHDAGHIVLEDNRVYHDKVNYLDHVMETLL